MRLSGFRWVRSMNSVFGLFLCLVLVGLITAGAMAYTAPSSTGGMLPGAQVCQAEPLEQNDFDYALSAIAGDGPVIQVWEANPILLDTATSFAVYTFKVRYATDIQINEAGVNIKSISNPSGATLQGTADGLPASAIPTDDSGKFVCTIVASNDNGTVTKALELSLAKELLPEGPPAGSTENQTKNKSRWLEQTGSQAPLTHYTPSTTNPSNPDFPQCPESCKYCLEPGDAAKLGFTQKCSDQRCFYDPENKRSWYCYSEPEGWCCANEKVSQATKSECTQIGGFWSTYQAEAIEACQPKGYCCLNGQLYYPSTQAQCVQMGGSNWSTNQAQTMERCQPVGYCCRDGQVYSATQAQCAQQGGSYWSTNQAQTAERCRPQMCWCCAYGKVYQTTQAACVQSGGACYATQSQAAAACRGQGETPYYPPTYLR